MEEMHKFDKMHINQRQITVIVVGAGNRGKSYSQYALEFPNLVKVIGVAEPRDITRELMVKAHNIAPEFIYKDWKDLAKVEKRLADAVLICTQDRMHAEPAIHFANKGYHILLEKPMSVTEPECRAIVDAVEKNNVILCVGHVLRYTPYTLKIKQLIDSGAVGKVVNIQHVEPVGWFHQAHSYVRGNWRNTKESTFMLMAKSCHDMDWLTWMMGCKLQRVSSFGSLFHFRKDQKPKGASDRCMTCPVESECAYSAKKIYLDTIKKGHAGWPVNVIAEIPTVDSVTQALETGPYGRCVYECDNDVVDNQVVIMQFEGGSTATFTMIAFSKDICERKTRIYGTKGEIEGDGHTIKHFDFLNRKTTEYTEEFKLNTKMTGHGGADYYLMKSFVEAVAFNDPSKILSNARETLMSHLAVFAAENSRVNQKIVDLSW